MEKTKIIDLLNKIANGEDVPKLIKYNGNILRYCNDDKDYMNPDGDGEFYLFYGTLAKADGETFIKALNDEVEILEEKNKIEPINKTYKISNFAFKYPEVAKIIKDIGEKQKEIITYINKEENK